MRKLLIVGFLGLLSSCGEDQDNDYQISGTVVNPTEGQKIFVSELNETNTQTVIIDTAEVVDGQFQLDLPEKDKPAISFLTLEGTRGNVLYIAENAPLNFTIYPDSLYASTVSGGEHTEILYSYLGEMRETNRKMTEMGGEMREAYMQGDSARLANLQRGQEEIAEQDMNRRLNLVRENPNSIVSLMVLQDMLNTQIYDSSELRELFENLDPEVKNTSLGQMFDQNLKKKSVTEVGNKAPDFSAPTPEGEELALNEVLGKVTLVDFWASWCKPCRDENPNIVETYKKYHDQGFNIIQVSLDRPGQKDRWEQAIENDNLEDWHHVSNLMFWQDPIAAKYGIRAIPAAFLLDENGVIVARDLRGKDLGEKVGELLSE